MGYTASAGRWAFSHTFSCRKSFMTTSFCITPWELVTSIIDMRDHPGGRYEGIHFQASGTYSRCAVLLRSDAVSWLLANHEWLADGAILQQLQDSIPGTERVSPSARRTGKATRH